MKKRPHPSRRDRVRRPRGAALYVLVLSVSLVVSLVGMAGLAVVRIERQRAAAAGELLRARANARSAVELALAVIHSDPDWRTRFTNAVETPPQTLVPGGKGAVSWILQDSDGSLAVPDTDLRLKGVGRVGSVVQVSSIKIDGTPVLLDVFQRTTYSAQNITVGGVIYTAGGPISTPGNILVNNTLNGDAEAGSISGGGVVTGTKTVPFAPLTLPPATVFDTYAAMATPINYYDVPNAKITKVVISPGCNPYGTPNPKGVYYVEIPAGVALSVVQCRIVGTFVVLLNQNSSFKLTNANFWQRTVDNYPMVIVKGTTGSIVDFNGFTGGYLIEKTLKTNFNPPSTPYEGQSDEDQSDSYPAEFNGLIHVIGSDVQTGAGSNFVLRGSMVCEGPVTLGSNYKVSLDPQLYLNPPVGYTQSSKDPLPVKGSWLWDVAP